MIENFTSQQHFVPDVLANKTSQELVDELQKRLYAIPVEKLAEYSNMFEVEYINRMAANSGYVDTEADTLFAHRPF